MFFRFGSAVALVVVVALGGTTLESRSLALRRALSHQRYQIDVLTERQARLRVAAQRAGAPAQLIEPLEQGRLHLLPPESPQRKTPRSTPLMNWTRTL
ncbi:MAG: hypothetical protein U0872_13965 [Planctomycetaceae bacterium]